MPYGPEPSAPDEPIARVPASQGQLRSARRLLRRKGVRSPAGSSPRVARRSPRRWRPRVRASRSSWPTTRWTGIRICSTCAARTRVPAAAAGAREVAGLSDTVTPQGILAICRTVDISLAEALAGSPRLVVLCDQVRDPGNLGTVIRCADAFGADAVLVSAESVDVYNAKTVRASTGSLFHLPLAVGVDLAEAVALGHAAGMAVLGADGAAEHTIDNLARSGALDRSDPLGPGKRGPGSAGRAPRADRPPGRAADVRAGREPQPLHCRSRDPVRHRNRPAWPISRGQSSVVQRWHETLGARRSTLPRLSRLDPPRRGAHSPVPNASYDPVQVTPLNAEQVEAMVAEAFAAFAAAGIGGRAEAGPAGACGGPVADRLGQPGDRRAAAAGPQGRRIAGRPRPGTDQSGPAGPGGRGQGGRAEPGDGRGAGGRHAAGAAGPGRRGASRSPP